MAVHDEDQESEKGFRVVDRRRFTPTGEIRSDNDAADTRETSTRESTPAVQKSASSQEPPKRARSESSDLRGGRGSQAPGDADPSSIDFLSFAASLATNALAALGLLPDEHARGLPRNPELAREYIEVLAMLQQKTRGNLTRQEEAALAQMLTDLRVQYVESTRAPAGPRR